MLSYGLRPARVRAVGGTGTPLAGAADRASDQGLRARHAHAPCPWENICGLILALYVEPWANEHRSSIGQTARACECDVRAPEDVAFAPPLGCPSRAGTADQPPRNGGIHSSLSDESSLHDAVQNGLARSHPAGGNSTAVHRKREMANLRTSGTRTIGPAVDLFLLLALSTLWGASYTFIRVGVETIPPLTFIAARTLVAGSLLLAWMYARGIALPRDFGIWRRFLVQALLNSVAPFTLIAWGEQSLEAGLATILNSISPVIAFLGTWLIARHEQITLRKLFGVVAGLTGVCLIVGVSAFEGVGHGVVRQLAIIAASICYAAAAIYGRSFKGLPPAIPAAGSMLVGAVLLIPASVIIDRPWLLHPSAASVEALIALSAFSTALAFVIYFKLVQTLGSVGTTSQAYLRVPIGVAISVIFLGESLSPTASAGLICVVAGVVAMTIPPRRSHGDDSNSG